MLKLTYVPAGMGWLRDLPDIRDRTPEHPEVISLLRKMKTSRRKGLRSRVDLREHFSDVTNQSTLNSSTAHACIALVEYFQRRTTGTIREHSPMFLYKVTRQLQNLTGDSGADLRTTIKALIRFGLPPQKYLPNDPAEFDRELSAFEFRLTDAIPPACYVRLDPFNLTGEETLLLVKSFLACRIPSVFGFSVPSSLSGAPDIPYRPGHDSFRGGQAAVAVGYDDKRMSSTKGALLIRSSWGTAWGSGGYGWLPYSYVTQQLAVDFWTILTEEWLRSGEFRCPNFEATGVKAT